MKRSSNKALVEYLIEIGVLKSPRIIRAFLNVDRSDFVLPKYKEYAYVDDALPHLSGQTISQPSVVALMIEMLSPRGVCFDIGSGSGYTSAILSYLCRQVVGFEIKMEIFKYSLNKLRRYRNVRTVLYNPYRGLQGLKCDSMLVSAEARDIPEFIDSVLKIGGKAVLPVNGSLVLLEKTEKGLVVTDKKFGFAFVPLIREGDKNGSYV